MTLGEKAAYIQGLADGVELDETTKEGKLIAALIDLVGDMADAIEALEDDVDTLGDYVEELDEDLGSVEELLYDEEDELDCDCDCDCDGDCSDCDCDCDLEDEEFFEVECPACGEKFEYIIAEEDLKALDGEE